MVRVDDSDSLLYNVKTFFYRDGIKNTQCTSGKLVAAIADGTPLIAKNAVGSGRLVEFGCYSSSCGAEASYGWDASTDGHLLIANAVAWCGFCV
ncbi:hypothetical protein P9112_009600 [Eukaryota sp. TZLM1-RC]